LLSLACGLVTAVSWHQKDLFSWWSQMNSHEVFNSVLMHCNSGGWFVIGSTIFGNVLYVLLPVVKIQSPLCCSLVALVALGYLRVVLQHFLAKPTSFFFFIHCWHIVNDYKKSYNLWVILGFNFICQTTTTINLRFVLGESNSSNQYLSKCEW
jgi:hypothetical protein